MQCAPKASSAYIRKLIYSSNQRISDHPHRHPMLRQAVSPVPRYTSRSEKYSPPACVGVASRQHIQHMLRRSGPPEAATGIFTASLTAAVISMSYPSVVPSAFMTFSTISPAPSSSACFGPFHHINPRVLSPPIDEHLPLFPAILLHPIGIQPQNRRTPNLRAISANSFGFCTAAELTDTFSAPAWINRVASSSVRIPRPPSGA